jgi:hypothetical protein
VDPKDLATSNQKYNVLGSYCCCHMSSKLVVPT